MTLRHTLLAMTASLALMPAAYAQTGTQTGGTRDACARLAEELVEIGGTVQQLNNQQRRQINDNIAKAYRLRGQGDQRGCILLVQEARLVISEAGGDTRDLERREREALAEAGGGQQQGQMAQGGRQQQGQMAQGDQQQQGERVIQYERAGQAQGQQGQQQQQLSGAQQGGQQQQLAGNQQGGRQQQQGQQRQQGQQGDEPQVQVEIEQEEPQVVVDSARAQLTLAQPQPNVTIRQQQPEITIERTQPVVNVTIPKPIITIEQPVPRVTVHIPQPIVEIEMPELTMDMAQTQSAQTRGEAQVQIEQAEPQVRFVGNVEPRVIVRQEEAEVRVREVGIPERAEIQQQMGQQQTRQTPMLADAEGAAVVARDAGAVDVAQDDQQAWMQGPLYDLTVEELEDMDVIGQNGEDIGGVEAVATYGNNVYVVVEHGGVLGIGDAERPIDVRNFTLVDEKLVLRTMTEEELDALPDWDQESYERLTGDTALRDAWQTDAAQ